MSLTSDSSSNSLPDTAATPIEDVQGRPDTRRLPINKVGIKAIRHPVRIQQRAGGEIHTVATFTMTVDLPHNFKGTHMSRFVEILNNHDYEITVDSFRNMMAEMTERLEAHAGHVEMRFPYFVNKTAPVSQVQSLMDYEVAFYGDKVGECIDIRVEVQVPVTSLCPCSKKISERGAHNQRSHVTICAKLNDFMWLEELIDIAESEASCELFGILKRPDEKHVTERAYDNPKFVEDLVRDVAARLNAEPRVSAYKVESENFESIHNHSAYAMIERDKLADPPPHG